MKLHIGCGKRDFGPDWINIDGADYPHIDHHNVTKLPFRNNIIDLIYSCHLISYFNREEIVLILNEWKRVLKPGGVLRLAVPDFQAMASLYVKGEFQLDKFLGPLYGVMSLRENTIYHKTTYDYTSLANLLQEVGFKEVRRYDWRQTEHAEYDDHSQAFLPHMDKENGKLISLNIECTK